jgi:hypothetical protein
LDPTPRPERIAKLRERIAAPVAAAAPKPKPEPKPAAVTKRGRPLIEDRGATFEATKPWLAAGMSRASWYRRRAG